VDNDQGAIQTEEMQTAATVGEPDALPGETGVPGPEEAAVSADVVNPGAPASGENAPNKDGPAKSGGLGEPGTEPLASRDGAGDQTGVAIEDSAQDMTESVVFDEELVAPDENEASEVDFPEELEEDPDYDPTRTAPYADAVLELGALADRTVAELLNSVIGISLDDSYQTVGHGQCFLCKLSFD
jgi:hypothetical protein